MVSAGLVIALLAQTAGSSPPAPTPPKCEGIEYAAFDFWVGEWDVTPAGADMPIAHSTIEKLYAGCAIRENWRPLSGNVGGSLNGYDPVSRQWYQTWIGSAPGPVQFVGGPVPGKMVLTGSWRGSGPNGEDGLTRMTYSRVETNAVRQHGEFSGDHGLTWVTTFDLIYRPRKKEEG
ncbi:hypothetical protein ACWPM1_07300 [Tsuneonella sp. HG249]